MTLILILAPIWILPLVLVPEPDPDFPCPCRCPCQEGQGELIFYERPDTTGPKLSTFTITPTDDPDGLEVSTETHTPHLPPTSPNPSWAPQGTGCARAAVCRCQVVLGQALGVLGVVRKQRLLFLCGQTRVHLDSVEGLGDFLELEVSQGAQVPAQGAPGEAHTHP